MRVESVAWATERRDVVSGFFFLLSLTFWLRRPRPARGIGDRYFILAWLAYLFGLLSKVTAGTLPAALIVLDVYPLRRLPADVRQWTGRPYRRIWLEKLPFLIASGVFAGVCLLATNRLVPLSEAIRAGVPERIAQSLFGIAFYLVKTLLPLRLSPTYEWPWSQHEG